ncbi:HlyD family efflux transporter periplasmic adaptor subunit [bacterium]|nr:HlyD family efflux transporter periplasmic adaptor subunit [bacterium]
MKQSLYTIDELKSLTENCVVRCYASVRRPRMISVIAAFCAVCIPLSAFSLIFLPWQQVSIGRGRVIAYAPENREQTVEAPIDGRIEQWLVREGQRVSKGDPLVRLADIDPNIIERLHRQYESLKVKLEATEQALSVSRLNLERQEKLAKEGLSSQRAYELAQLEVAKYRSETSAAEAKLAEMEVKLSRQQSQVIQADQDSIVMRILRPQGGVMVSTGEQLAVLVPDAEDRVVELLIVGNDLPLITPGRKVRLQFEGWPAVQFSGWPSVAIGTFGGVVRYVDQADNGDGNYRVLIFPDPEDQPWPSGHYLRRGVRVVGWILLDEVSLGWEVWRRLNGFPVTVGSGKDSENGSGSFIKVG